MNIVKECPCCGSSVNEESELRWDERSRLLIGRGLVVQIPKMQARVFNALWNARPRFRPISSMEMKAIIYADDPSGGSSARSIVSVHVMNLKKVIEPFGLTVMPYTGYVLVDLPRKSKAVSSSRRLAVSA